MIITGITTVLLILFDVSFSSRARIRHRKWAANSDSSINTLKIFYLNQDLYINYNKNTLKKYHLSFDNNNNNNNSITFNEDNLIEKIGSNLIGHCFTSIKRPRFNFYSRNDEIVYSNENCFSKMAQLDLTNNYLTRFPRSIAHNWFPYLKTLNLSNNLLTNLSVEHDFSPCVFKSSLQTLDFSFNNLESIDEDMFKDFKELKVLNLASNRIKSISLFSFTSNAQNLLVLDLSQNKIGTSDCIEFLLFSSLVNLKVLNLSSNQLRSFSTHLLYNLFNLERLKLSMNQLERFDLFELNCKNNPKLIELDLSFNSGLDLISDAFHNEPNESLSNIQTLNLAGLNLAHAGANFINEIFQRKFSNLLELNLSSTRLLKQTLNPLKWPQNLRHIDLSQNQMTEIKFCEHFGSKIESIDLGFNQFKEFKRFLEQCGGVFLKNHTTHRIRLNLRNNLFDNLDLPSEFQNNNRNLGIYLANNPLVCDCDPPNSWWTKKWSDSYSIIKIEDFTSLECKSQSDDSFLNQNRQSFTPIDPALIAPTLVCPYKLACPSQCKCIKDFAKKFNIINCTHINLTQIPLNFPSQSTELLLNHNQLKRIQPNQFGDCLKCITLNLEHNQIHFIEENAFHGLVELKTLILSQNQLQILLGYEFNTQGLTNLEELYLNSNRLQFISNFTFINLHKLRLVNLAQNNLLHPMVRDSFFKHNPLLTNIIIQHAVSYLKLSQNRKLITNRINNGYVMNLIRTNLNLTENNNSLPLIDCVFNRFRAMLINNSSFLSKNKDNMLNLLGLNEFRHVFNENFLRIKALCDEMPKMLNYLSDEEVDQEQNYFYEEVKKDEKTLLNSYFKILNLNTHIKWILVFFVSAFIVLSFSLAFLISKLRQQSQDKNNHDLIGDRNRTHNFKTFFNDLFSDSSKMLMNTDNSNNHNKEDNDDDDKEVVINYGMNYANTRRKPRYNRSKIMHKTTDTISSTTSPTGSVSSILTTTISSSVSSSSSSSSSELEHDLFLVYNKLDTDLCKKIIGPVFRSTPFNLKIAYLHDYVSSSTFATPGLCETLLKTSTLVIFVLSKNLLNESEYKIMHAVPHERKLAILVDNSVNESAVQRSIQPNKILKCSLESILNNNMSVTRSADIYSVKNFLINSCKKRNGAPSNSAIRKTCL
jgi:Leucine-rich repeat (LRR) protein